MNTLFIVLPFVISLLIVGVKSKLVGNMDGEKYALREIIILLLKIVLLTIVSFSAYFILKKEVSLWANIIDVIMLIIFILAYKNKTHEFIERKALMGIWASIILMIVLLITIIQMLLGIYSFTDYTIVFCFIKGVFYFSISIWIVFTNGKKKKLIVFVTELIESFKSYKINSLDYFAFAFWGLFIFTGGNGFIVPLAVFGFHEIMNKRWIKGLLYIISGNAIIYVSSNASFISSIAFVVYTLVALVDLFVQAIKRIKKKKSTIIQQ